MPIKHIVQAQADKYARGMFLRQEQYALRVKSRYDHAVGQLLDLARQVKDDVGDTAFRFTDYPQTRNEATKVIRQLYTGVYGEIKNGVEAEWEYANLSCDGLVQSVFGKQCIDNDLYAQYFERNREAMEQFFKRKSALREGLGLSERVWKYAGDLRTELENAVTVSLGEGVSAATMSRRVRQYLREPDKLFRRVRGADGKLHLSAAAKAFHPGQGVYRSSYKNAMRLARTETNAAYRLADESRWGKMDFVVGMEIKKSNNHPEEDICDTLCGKYPKDFKFSAWHPQCRCYVTPVLCTPEEMARMQRNILSGNADANVGFRSVNEVTAPPKVFKDWVRDNQGRIVRAKSLPYFLRDNGAIKNGEWVYGNSERHNILKSIKESANLYPEEYRKEIIELSRSTAPLPTINNHMRDIEKNISHSVKEYGKVFAEGTNGYSSSPVISELMKKLSASQDYAERVRLINLIKAKSAVKMRWELRKVGYTQDLSYSRTQNNYHLGQKIDRTIDGNRIIVEPIKLDVVTYKDKYGKEYSYSIGDNIQNMNSAHEVSLKVVGSMPKYARKQFKGLLFTEKPHPNDLYFREYYKDAGFRGAMYAGEPISIHMKYDAITGYDITDFDKGLVSLRNDLLHELGHHVQTKLDIMEYYKAVVADNKYFREYSKNAIFSKRYYYEDVADSFSLYITNPVKMKAEYPNRYNIIKTLAYKL